MKLQDGNGNLAHGDCDYLHQYKVRWYVPTSGIKDSGKASGVITEVSDFSSATWRTDDIYGSGNPSYNNSEGMRIYFWCETCSVEQTGAGEYDVGLGLGTAHVLHIYQHKGNTHIEWGPDEPCELTMVERAAIAERAKWRFSK